MLEALLHKTKCNYTYTYNNTRRQNVLKFYLFEIVFLFALYITISYLRFYCSIIPIVAVMILANNLIFALYCNVDCLICLTNFTGNFNGASSVRDEVVHIICRRRRDTPIKRIKTPKSPFLLPISPPNFTIWRRRLNHVVVCLLCK